MALLGRNDLAKVLRSFFLIWIPSKNHGHTVKSTVPQVMPCMTRRGYEQKEWRIRTLVVATTLA